VPRGGVQARSYPAYRSGGGGYRTGAPVYRSGGPVYRGGGSIYRSGGIARGGVRFGGPRSVIVGRSAFYRPYYSFRPRLSLGFGLWVGYPVAYPYYYDYPYGYAYPYPADPYPYGYAAPNYGYPAAAYPPPSQSSVYPSSSYPQDYPESSPPEYSGGQSAPPSGTQRDNQGAPGGVSFEITPETAAVFVDGTYVGTAGAFGPTNQPLGLISGRHHIEIRASGYRTMTFDADVRSGQVIPFQGTLQRN